MSSYILIKTDKFQFKDALKVIFKKSFFYSNKFSSLQVLVHTTNISKYGKLQFQKQSGPIIYFKLLLK